VRIQAVLFDCDGVLQRPSNDWRGESGTLTGLSGERLEPFLDAVSDAEQPVLDGSRPFVDVLDEVVHREGLDVDPADLIGVWQHLIVDPQMLDAARRLEAEGIECALGTNQHRERAAYMREALGYDSIFEPMVISAEIGVAKPDPRFFEIAVEQIGVPAEQVLFVDDVRANVEGARSVGLVAEHFAKDAGRPELDRILALHGLAERVAA
jgi:HAD superfamily hydrolase (TIGR01493 family)